MGIGLTADCIAGIPFCEVPKGLDCWLATWVCANTLLVIANMSIAVFTENIEITSIFIDNVLLKFYKVRADWKRV